MTHRLNEDKVWLHPGTRLHMLVYSVYSQSWEAWTATNSRNGPSSEWRGTYLQMFSDGKCIQHFRSETEVRELVIRPATKGVVTYERTQR